MNSKNITVKASNIFPILLVIYQIVNYLSIDSYLPAMPAIAKEFSATDYLIQWTLTIFFLGNIVAQLILGSLSERYGRRTVLLMGGVVFLIATLLSILTPNFELLVVARFFQGMAVTSMIIAGSSTIHAMFEQEEAVKTLAWMGGINILAPALGPLLGALILKIADWRWIFILLFIGATPCLIALYRFMPETAEPSNLITSPRKTFQQYGQILSNWSFMQPTICICLLFAAMTAWSVAGPFLIVINFQSSELVFGLLQTIIFISFILGTRLVAPLMKKFPLATVGIVAATIAGLGGLSGFLIDLFYPNHILNIVLPMLPITFGLGIGFSVLNRQAIESNEEKPLGIKVAVFSFCISVSAVLISFIVSSFFSSGSRSFSLLLFLLALSTLLISNYKLLKNGVVTQ